ncbi:MAG: DUF89 family protein [Spirochaetes bacterium]|nr:DUF89 family protein [Spirochaetota bacterium]MBN2771094.1 DUF89 family protein [Spirochaetota bacterium]
MKSFIDCIPCFVRQSLDACRMITSDEEIIRALMPKLLAELSSTDLTMPPPAVVSRVHRIIRKELNNSDPYRKLKKQSTRKALELSKSAEDMIAKSNSPFDCAVRFAIAGNILDFGAKTDWNEDRVMNSFKSAMKKPLTDNQVTGLYSKIEMAKTVLVLGDNAGEALFDRLLIEKFPGDAKVYYAVKGSPVINDVTEEDALDVNLDKVACIISNGADIPGTMLSECSDEFKQLFKEADVVVSKGQGNFETLNENGREIFFILQIKCASLAHRNGYTEGDWVVTSTTSLKELNE